MASKQKLEFANFTLTFGEKEVLLDNFDELVFPIFEESRYVRKYGRGPEYFFLDTRVVKLGGTKNKPIVGIAGRFVNNTKLKRVQIYRPAKGLVPDSEEIESAPSSTYLLLLHNHRLIFSREVVGGPTLRNFESTCRSFLMKRRREYLDEEYERLKKTADSKTKKLLNIEIKFPDLRITPLTDAQSLSEFIARFGSIDSVNIKLLKTNNENYDGDEFWNNLGDVGEEINSLRTAVRFSNSKDGLDPAVVKEQTESATKLANSDVNISGSDISGADLRGTNEDFNLSVDVERLSNTTELSAERNYATYRNLVNSGQITEPEINPDIILEVAAIYRRSES